MLIPIAAGAKLVHRKAKAQGSTALCCAAFRSDYGILTLVHFVSCHIIWHPPESTSRDHPTPTWKIDSNRFLYSVNITMSLSTTKLAGPTLRLPSSSSLSMAGRSQEQEQDTEWSAMEVEDSSDQDVMDPDKRVVDVRSRVSTPVVSHVAIQMDS